MNNKPLTFKQAADALQQYSHLKGQTITTDNQPYTIEWVAIAPFAQEEQSSFAEKVFYLEDWKLALHTYSGNMFTIMLIAINQELKLDFTFMDIDTYLKKYKNRLVKTGAEMDTAA